MSWRNDVSKMATVKEFQPGKSFSFELPHYDAKLRTTVTISLEPREDGGTNVELTKGEFPEDTKYAEPYARHSALWGSALANLKSVIENGKDLRDWDKAESALPWADSF